MKKTDKRELKAKPLLTSEEAQGLKKNSIFGRYD